MDVESILGMLLLFGGGTVIAVSFSPVGRAIADRIRGDRGRPEADPAVYEELERMRGELSELHERVEFTERLLAGARDREALPGAQ